MRMKTAEALGNLEESFRPFLGRIVFTDCVHGSTPVRGTRQTIMALFILSIFGLVATAALI
jgi:hypothetical protein